jgi:UDP-arabinose 4-epimerase
MKRTILVTGGAGYVGSMACKLIAKAGDQPVVFDNLARGHRWAVKWGPLEEGDLADRARLAEVLRKHKPEAVMHFAAFAYVGESVEQPALYYRNNVVGSLNLLEAMRDCGVGRLIFSSSCATYGEPRQLPIDEGHPQQPVSPYGAGKLAAEEMLHGFDRAHGLRFVSLRYFNAAAADPEGEIGEDHQPETHLIPLALHAASGRQPQLRIFGRDYPTPDGTCVRDYIHVHDLAEAHLLALKRLEQGGESDAYNLGNGQGFSVQQVVAAVEKTTGRRVPIADAPRRAGDPPMLISDSAKAIRELGWKPRYGALEVQIEHAWKWHQRHFR